MNDDLRTRKASIPEHGPEPYLWCAAAFLLLHIFHDPTVDGFIRANMRLFLLFGVVCAGAAGLYLDIKGRLTTARIAALIMVAGVLIRMTYVLYTGINTRQHDTADMTGFGHWGYIMHFTRQWALPGTNEYQFYHPPLHHILAAAWYRVNAFFHMEQGRNLESIQYLTALYSSWFMVVCHRIFVRLKLRGIVLLSATALIAFHPTLILLSGSVNNDMLATLLYAATFLWLMKWYDSPDVKHSILLALCIGAGMMTKLSVATMAFVIAPFFVAKLLKRRTGRAKTRVFRNIMLFGLISIPLGMWHSVRNFLVFNQAFGFVPAPGGSQFKGDFSLMERLLPFPPGQVVARLNASPWEDMNLSVYILKSSLFGEWQFGADVNALAAVLIALNLIMIIFSIAAMGYVMTRKRREYGASGWMLFALWVVQMVFMVYFYVKLPFGCTMDFRYMVPTLISGVGFIGMAMEMFRGDRRWVLAPVVGFCLLSAAFYLLI